MRSYGLTNAIPWASAPAVGAAGDTYFNTTLKRLFVSDGTAWQPVDPQVVTTAWTNLTLLNSLVAYGAPFPAPAYRKVGDSVECRGLVKNPTAGNIAAGTVMANLPAGFLPTGTLRFAVNGSPVNANSEGYMCVNVTSAGAMSTQFLIPASNGFIFLDNVRFSVTA